MLFANPKFSISHLDSYGFITSLRGDALLATVFISVALPATAQTTVAALPQITISATRQARSTEDVPATVSVITAEDIEQKRIEDIRDLVAEEPAITVRRQPARFSAAASGIGRDGNASFNIRGIDGNRVLIQIDGIRLPNAFSFGATNTGRGGYLDMSAIGRAEILRGPASALYGSDGLAGAVSFYTRSPRELLNIFKSDTYAAISASYGQEDKAAVATISAAARLGDHEALVIASTRRANALKNFGTLGGTGTTRTLPNPQDLQGGNVLAKWVTQVSPDNHITATAEVLQQKINTNVLTAVVGASQYSPVGVLDMRAFDDIKRNRFTLQQELLRLNLDFADSVQWGGYAQDASNRQLSFEARTNGTTRIRDQRYAERVQGLSVQASKAFFGNISQKWTYGLDASSSTYVGNSDGTLPPAGETFPTKRFPDTDYNLLGVFAQNEIGFNDDTVLVVPALRYDRYRLNPEASALFPNGIPAASSGSAVTPKLGIVWKFATEFSLYANAAQGFRAPTPDQVNQGFANLINHYKSIANPNLQPEKNTSAEIGLRKTRGALGFEVSAFTGRYKNFIEQIQVQGDFTAANPRIFQFVNLTNVRLKGVEAKVAYAFESGIRLHGGFAQVRGTQTLDGERVPVNSVNPPRLLAGIGYKSRDGALAVDLNANHYAAKKAKDISNALTPPAQPFLPAAATMVDLNAYWRINKHFSGSAGITNLTNKKVWLWSDVIGRAANAIDHDAYTQAPRSISVALKAEF